MKPFLIILLALLAAACGRPSVHSQESYVFGTRVEVLVWGAPEEQARAATAEVLREFDRLHRTYHAWQPSEMTALNDALAAGQAHEVTPEFAGFIGDAQALSAKGEYLFDPGIGRLIELWGFHDDTFKAQLPDQAKLDALIAAKPSIGQLNIDGLKVWGCAPSLALLGTATSRRPAPCGLVSHGGAAQQRNEFAARNRPGAERGEVLSFHLAVDYAKSLALQMPA